MKNRHKHFTWLITAVVGFACLRVAAASETVAPLAKALEDNSPRAVEDARNALRGLAHEAARPGADAVSNEGE